VIMDRNGKTYFGLDDVGSRLWAFLDRPRTIKELTGLLASEYDAPVNTIASDVLAFLTQLRKAKLLEI